MEIRIAAFLSSIAFFCATSLSAECSWILWKKVTLMQDFPETKRTEYWDIEQTHTSLKACKDYLEKNINALREGAILVGFKPRSVSAIVEGSKGTIIKSDHEISDREPNCTSRTIRYFTCVPDTIDPREQTRE